jgi:cyclopropane fatty-acyl-phospholipid synthase-like methyltransferase
MNNTLRKIYDAFAKTYEENRGQFDMSDVLDGFYSTLDLENGKLLDLGCGAGEPVARYFTDHNWSVVGVDFSEQMIQLASKYVPEMSTMHADISEVDFESNQFDAIIASYSLFHISVDKHKDMFKKFHKWLFPNGKALFTYATEEYTGKKSFDGYKNFMGQELYYSHKAPDELYIDLEDIGFNIDSIDYRNIGGETFLWVTVNKRPL